MEDRDQLPNLLATSHDLHQQVIDDREDTLICKAKYWLDCAFKVILMYVFYIIT